MILFHHDSLLSSSDLYRQRLPKTVINARHVLNYSDGLYTFYGGRLSQ